MSASYGQGGDHDTYFRLLAAVVAADGEIRRSEVTHFAGLIERVGGDPSTAWSWCFEALDRRAVPLWFLEGVRVSRAHAQRSIGDGLTLAASDGWAAPSEQRLLATAAHRMGFVEMARRLGGDQLGDMAEACRGGAGIARAVDGRLLIVIALLLVGAGSAFLGALELGM